MYTPGNNPGGGNGGTDNSDYGKLYSGSVNSMGTVITFQLYSKSEKEANAIYADIKEIYQVYDNAADDGFDAVFGQSYNSELAKLNRDGNIYASDELVKLLEFALDMQEKTKGYFNPFMGELNHKWKKYMDKQEYKPSLGEIKLWTNQALNTTVEIKGNYVQKKGDALIDLGGIAKGFATYQVELYLKEKGIKNYLLNAGNSNISLGENPKADNYKVALAYVYGYPNKKPEIEIVDGHVHVDGKKTNVKASENSKTYVGTGLANDIKAKVGDIYFSTDYAAIYVYSNTKKWILTETLYLASLEGENINVVTSSPEQQHYFDGNGMVHHLINPYTGYPRGYKDPQNPDQTYDPNDVDSVTLIGENSGLLDAYSTALFVMPLNDAKIFMQENNIEGVITKDGEIIFNTTSVIK